VERDAPTDPQRSHMIVDFDIQNSLRMAQIVYLNIGKFVMGRRATAALPIQNAVSALQRALLRRVICAVLWP
jgi:hypothetical protein